jgi:3-hydroxy-9,10-secoandrosta-1,3,5(10)-triene-9,17-dione monooxygenase reductase component
MTISPTWRSAPSPPCIDARSFRAALGAYATGVAFVTTTLGKEPVGLIVNSLVSVSLDPPLVSFCVSRTSTTWSRMREARRLGVNILGRRHEEFVRRAAPAGADRFAEIRWRLVRGVPLLIDAPVCLECEIETEHRAGDHWIVVAEVHGLRTVQERDPLVFYGGAFHRLSPNPDIPHRHGA